MYTREVKTCGRCRQFKRRCDLVKPTCSRCLLAGVRCSFDTTSSNGNTSSGRLKIELPRLARSESTSDTDGLPAPPTGLPEPKPFVQTDGSPATDTGYRLRKRKRTCLSCFRCHRLKVKCDRRSPCSRCSASGHQKNCCYSYKSHEGDNSLSLFTAGGEDTGAAEGSEQLITAWHARHRGPSHWRELMMKLSALPFTIAAEEISKETCSSNSGLSENFPFGSPNTSKYNSRETVIALVHRAYNLHQTYIRLYLDTFDCVYPVLDTGNFQNEVDEYWSDPESASPGWLAQFLMVLGLGCSAVSRGSSQAIEFFMAAEACLLQTPFMVHPELSTLRTICLMLLAKQATNFTCSGLDACWILLGLLVRLALMCGLHQVAPSSENQGASVEEWERRHCLWVTIRYMDMKASMTTGMPPAFQEAGFGGLQEPTPCRQGEGTIDPQQAILERSFSTIYRILSQVNSPDNKLSYDEVLQYNVEVRQLMRQIDNARSDRLVRTTLDIYFRRVLLVLHRHFALDPSAPALFAESYWSSLECSLALLKHYLALSGDLDSDNSDSSCVLSSVSGLFMLDFFVAVLTTCVHLLRPDSPLAEAAAASECRTPPRRIIMETLRSCMQIGGKEKDKSVCYQIGYRFLETIVNFALGTSPVLG